MARRTDLPRLGRSLARHAGKANSGWRRPAPPIVKGSQYDTRHEAPSGLEWILGKSDGTVQLEEGGEPQ